QPPRRTSSSRPGRDFADTRSIAFLRGRSARGSRQLVSIVSTEWGQHPKEFGPPGDCIEEVGYLPRLSCLSTSCRCRWRIAATSTTARGWWCTYMCEAGTTTSESTPSRWALWYGTTPSELSTPLP